MRATMVRVAKRFIPTAEQAWTMGLRFVLAGMAYAAARILEQDWMLIFAKLFLMMGLWGLLGIWEKQFVSHLRALLLRLWKRRSSTTLTAAGPTTS